MKVINLNSKFELTSAQISFVETIVNCGDDTLEPVYSYLLHEIPIFLVNEKTQVEYGNDLLGFYKSSERILSAYTPIIGLCLEKILKVAKSEEQLMILIAKVLIHELAHARMNTKVDKIDEFYIWIEEPMANLVTLKFFDRFRHCDYRNRNRFFRLNREICYAHVNKELDPFEFVKSFIENQPPNYQLGLDLFIHGVHDESKWSSYHAKIQHRTTEKNAWLKYVKANVGNTDRKTLNELYEQLHKYGHDSWPYSWPYVKS